MANQRASIIPDMDETYELEKWIWTEQDFEEMGWHDCHIYAVAFLPETFEFVLDLDYICKWVNPKPPAENFSFWVSPATLVFENVHDLELDTFDCSLDIADL